MNSRLSYVDRLNDEGQRKPSSALDNISQTLARLEKQLGRAFDARNSEDDITNRIKRIADEAATENNSPVRVAADPAREGRLSSFGSLLNDRDTFRRHDDQLASINSLAVELNNLRSDLQASINRGMREEFSTLREEINSVLGSVSRSHDAHGLEAGLAQIASSIAELSRRDDRDTQLLHLELGRLKAAIDDLLHLEQNRTDATLGQSLDALQERLDQIADNIGRLPDGHVIQVFDDHMRQLTLALEKLASHAHSDQRHLLEVIDERLDEISRAIAASAAVAHTSGIDPESLERIEARISSLAHQIEELNEDRPSVTVLEHLADLSDRVDEIARRIEIPEQSLERLTHCVALISERLEGVRMPPETEQMLMAIQAQLSQLSTAVSRHQADLLNHGAPLFHAVEEKLQRVVERLESIGTPAGADSLLAALDERFSDLARRMDDIRAAEDERSMQMLEQRLETMAKQLHSITGGSADPRLLHKLESQISHLSSLLARPGQDSVESLSPRLDELERFIVESRASLIEATRQAAEEVLQKFAASRTSEPMDARLQDELQKLEALTRQSAERNSRTFEAIHDTLLKIVSRLGTLEAEGSATIAQDLVRARGETAPAFGLRAPRTEDTARRKPAVSSTGAAPEPKSRLRALSRAFRRRQVNAEMEQAAPSLLEQSEPAAEALASDINAILRRVRSDRPAAMEERETLDNGSFVAAARRSILSASHEDHEEQKADDTEGSKSRLSIGSILRRHKKYAAAAIGGAMLLAGGVHFASNLSPSSFDLSRHLPAEAPARDGEEVEITADTSEAVDPLQTAATQSSEEPSAASETSKSMTERLVPQYAFAAPQTAVSEKAAENLAAYVPQEADLPAELHVKPLREAALEGNPLAYFEIAGRLAEGRGVPADMSAAAIWYERAAAKGLALAQYRIGNMYEKGLGVDRDLNKAKKWYEAAAKQGNATAMHNLGVLLAMGSEGTPDHQAAVRWFTEAADLNVTDSQFNLAILAAKGLGMPKDLTEAYKWLDIVARKGDADAAAKRDELAKVMDPEQLKIAEGKAKLWKARTPDLDANTVSIPVEWSETQISSNSPEYRKAIATVQAILNKMGYDAGAADGIVGNKTRNAIKAFQSQNGLPATGEIDDALVRKLLERSDTA